ncbi:hypothetical protein [Streptococcus uberis]|uniref:hypothetical protein n=1 Tax=Streptococcus uberis TaxID=1349 RepID=UPI001EF02FA3|nr:hypothetical protein [Streptococcus uberis]
MNFIVKNPMSNVTLAKRVKEKNRNNYFSVEELKEFLSIVKEEEPFKHHALFRLLAYTGARKVKYMLSNGMTSILKQVFFQLPRTLLRLETTELQLVQKINFPSESFI